MPTRLLALATTAALVAALPAPTLAAPAPPLIDARDCLSTLHVFIDDPQRLRPAYVPARYTLLTWVPGHPYVALWSWSCRSARVDGGRAAPLELGVAAVPVHHPERQPSEQPPVELPNTWSQYTHVIVSDSAPLVRRLAREGLPARHVPGITLRRQTVVGGTPEPLLPLSRADVAVPGWWTSTTTPVVQQEPAHSHSNEFWYDTGSGASVLSLRIPRAGDHFCELSAGRTCGSVQAPEGSPVRALLGAADRSADAAVDHEPLERLVATVSSRT